MANRYWVGGTGTWDASSTTNWSATSGGAGGASVPTSADYVTINASSGGGTITLAVNPSIQALDIRGFTGTLDFSTYKIDCAGNNLIILRQDSTATVTGTKRIDLSYNGATGTRTLGMTSVTEANALNVYVIAGTDTFTDSTNNIFGNLDFTGFAGTFSVKTRVIYGSLTISTGMTVAGGTTDVMTFGATSGTKTITSNGKSFDQPLTFNGVGGTWQLQDNLTTGSTRAVTLTNGALDLNSKTLTCGVFSSSNSNTRSLLFGATGEVILLGNGAAIWSGSTSTNFTMTGNKVVRSIYSGSTGTRTFNFGNALPAEYACSLYVSAGTDIISLQSRYYNLDLTGFGGTIAAVGRTIHGGFVIGSGCTFTGGVTTTFAATSGSHTITTNGVTTNESWLFNGSGATWSCSDNVNLGIGTLTFRAGTLKLKAGGTTTVNIFSTSGSTEQHYLQSTVAGSQATLSQTSGTVNATYLTIKDINATGGATWNAYRNLNNIDAGNNTGWDFLSTPVTTTTLAMRLGFGL